ncbi:hypothetical protein [Nannocystis pusilla]
MNDPRRVSLVVAVALAVPSCRPQAPQRRRVLGLALSDVLSDMSLGAAMS